MSVQAAVSSAGDFLQTAVSVGADSGAVSQQGGSDSGFKNVLNSMRADKPRNAVPQQGEGRKNYPSGVAAVGSPLGEPADEAAKLMSEAAASKDASTDTAAGSGEQSASRFDPDLILGGIGALPEDEPAPAETADTGTGDGATADEEPELPEGRGQAVEPGGEPAPDGGTKAAMPDAVPLPDAPPPQSDDENIPAGDQSGELSVKDKADVPDGGANAARPVATLIGEDAAASRRSVSAAPAAESGEPETDGGEDTASAKAKPDAPQGRAAASGEPEVPNRQAAAVGRENEASPENESKEPQAPSDVSDTKAEAPAPKADRDHAGGAEKAQGHNRGEGEAPAHAGEAAPAAANAFGQIAEAVRAEPQAVVRAPVTYTLVSPNTFGEGLLSVVEFMTDGKSSEVRIIVEPPALGRVDVSLVASANGVEALFRVDNEALRQMVQNQLDSLKESLEAQGIHVSGLTVDIRNGEGESGRNERGSGSRRKGADSEDDGEIAEDTRIARLDLERGLLHWVA